MKIKFDQLLVDLSKELGFFSIEEYVCFSW